MGYSIETSLSLEERAVAFRQKLKGNQKLYKNANFKEWYNRKGLNRAIDQTSLKRSWRFEKLKWNFPKEWKQNQWRRLCKYAA